MTDPSEEDRRSVDRRSVARLFRTTLVAFLASLLVMAVGGVLVRYAVSDANSRVIDRWVPVERSHNRLLQLMSGAESSLRGYALTMDDEFLQPYLDAQESYSARVAALLDLVGGDDAVRELIDEERVAAERWFDEWGSADAGLGRIGRRLDHRRPRARGCALRCDDRCPQPGRVADRGTDQRRPRSRPAGRSGQCRS